MAGLTLDDARAWRDIMSTDWSTSVGPEGNLESQMEKEEKAYFQRFDSKAPKQQWVVKTGSAPADCDAAIDTLTPTEIMVKVRPARAKQTYQDQADKLTRWALAMFHAWRNKKDPVRQVVTDMVIRRVGVARVMYDDRLWPSKPSEITADGLDDWEAMYRRKVPIVFERRSPKYCRWREDEEGNPLVVVEEYPTSVIEAKLALSGYSSVARILKGKEPTDEVTVSDIWVEGYRCMLLDDLPIFPGKGIHLHGYKQIPYIIFPFREMTFEDPGSKYRGLLTNALSLYEIESEVLTAETWMLMFLAWRTWMGHFVGGNKKIEVVPGQFIDVDRNRGEYLEILEGHPTPPELLQFASVIDSFIQRNGVSQGPRSVEGTRSGAQVWAIQSQRELRLESAKQALERGLERALELAAMILETKVGESMTLPIPGRDKDGQDRGQVIVGPKDIGGYWDAFDVSFGRRLDPAMLEQMVRLQGLAEKNWMPWEDSVEMSGATDVVSEWKEKLTLQQIDSQPMLNQLAALKQIEKWHGKDSDYYQVAVQMLMSMAKAPSPQGPGSAPPGTSQPLAFRGGGDQVPVGAQGGMPLNTAPEGGM